MNRKSKSILGGFLAVAALAGGAIYYSFQQETDHTEKLTSTTNPSPTLTHAESLATTTARAQNEKRALEVTVKTREKDLCPIGWNDFRNGSFLVSVKGTIYASPTQKAYSEYYGPGRIGGIKGDVIIDREWISDTEFYSHNNASWSPDGKSIIFSRTLYIQTLKKGVISNEWGNSSLWIQNLESGVQTQLTNDSTVSFDNAEFHPNGKSIIYERGSLSKTEVWAMDLETQAQYLVSSNASNPTYSSDGSKIFVEWREEQFENSGWRILNQDGSPASSIFNQKDWTRARDITFIGGNQQLAFWLEAQDPYGEYYHNGNYTIDIDSGKLTERETQCGVE